MTSSSAEAPAHAAKTGSPSRCRWGFRPSKCPTSPLAAQTPEGIFMLATEGLDIAAAAIGIARLEGARQSAATLRYERTVAVEVRDGKVERLQESARGGLSIAIYVDER